MGLTVLLYRIPDLLGLFVQLLRLTKATIVWVPIGCPGWTATPMPPMCTSVCRLCETQSKTAMHNGVITSVYMCFLYRLVFLKDNSSQNYIWSVSASVPPRALGGLLGGGCGLLFLTFRSKHADTAFNFYLCFYLTRINIRKIWGRLQRLDFLKIETKNVELIVLLIQTRTLTSALYLVIVTASITVLLV